ncbi:hypothetical protein JTB14_009052 [Gonioctena quinquepunctata]|nr:hypothetical protein JTB14_009052 [Gonioctena quinquepunctata]
MFKMVNVLSAVFFLVTFIAIGLAYPINDDLDSAATGDEHHGRVQIKVYRGPTEHSGHDSYAPWGYWSKQPADD